MTLDEAIAEMGVDPSQYTAPEFKIAVRNRAWARMGATGAAAACVLTGCHYERGAASLDAAIEAYWSTHARPEPPPEWREVEPAEVASEGRHVLEASSTEVRIRATDGGVLRVTPYMIRAERSIDSGIVEQMLLRHERTGGPS